MSLNVLHDAQGKILAAWRPVAAAAQRGKVVPAANQTLLEIDEPADLASLSVGQIGRSYAVDLASKKLVRR